MSESNQPHGLLVHLTVVSAHENITARVLFYLWDKKQQKITTLISMFLLKESENRAENNVPHCGGSRIRTCNAWQSLRLCVERD